MNLDIIKIINEDAKEDAGDKHIKEEKEYLEYGVKCLNGLVEFCEKEQDGAEDHGRIKDYKEIITASKELVDLLNKHLDRY